MKKKTLFITSILFILLALGVLGFVLHDYFQSKITNPFTQDIEKQTSFPIYYSEKLPEGFRLNLGSVIVEQGILNYHYIYDEDKILSVTQQNRPAVTEEVFGGKVVDTPIGPGLIANFNGRTAGIIKSRHTLILFSAPEKIKTQDLELLMHTLKLHAPPPNP